MRLTPVLLVLSLACSKDDGPNNSASSDNAPPLAQITSPLTGATLATTSLQLAANITDPDGESDIATVTWSSSTDGVLVDGTAAMPSGGISAFDTTLSPGNHVITLVVTDLANASSQDSVTVVVQDQTAASAPTVSLEPPFEDGVVDTTQPTTFTATVASDAYAASALSGTWTLSAGAASPEVRGPDVPSQDGALSVTFDTMPVGDLTLTLVVTDPAGEEAIATLDLTGVAGAYTDDDGDSVTVANGDCNDSDAAVFPGAEEVCSGADTDCDGVVDNRDHDGDGYIDSACTAYSGSIPTGDCADNDASISPGVIERENAIDDDCDGEIDDGTGNYDDDGDCVCENETCYGSVASGCSLSSGDCDDTDATISPLADEVCNAVDNDCNAIISDKDVDGDGFVDAECDGLFVGVADDCADDDAAIHPNAFDRPDAGDANVDANCDGIDGDASTAVFATQSGVDNPECSLDAPCATLNAAHIASSLSNRPLILLEGGAFTVPTHALLGGAFLSGGYSSDFTQHGGSDTEPTVIQVGTTGLVVNADGSDDAVTLQSLEVRPFGTPSRHAATLAVLDAVVVLDGVDIERGVAADGSDGLPGVGDWDEPAPDGVDGYWSSTDDGDVNPGVSNPDCLGGLVDRTSGFGGADGTYNEAGGAGGPAVYSPTGTIFRGGRGGDPGRSGAAAEDGSHGSSTHGIGGTGGLNDLVWNGNDFIGGTGAAGTLGARGTHGRGGGGAADGREGLNLSRGYKGGSGGAAGCAAASPGTGGERGYATMGIYARASTITVTSASSIYGGEAGDGGRGGDGALGQPGGEGGLGRGATQLAFSSGSGGDGGDGGASGGGGGGAGGNVYGLWLLEGSELVQIADLTIEPGLTGFGGAGGSASDRSFPAKGQTGEDGLTFDWFIQD